MLNKLLRFFAGNCRFSAENGLVERLLNHCAEEKILLWKLEKTPEGFRASCLKRNYPAVLELGRRVNVEVGLVEEKGLPQLIARYRFRVGILAGILFLLGFLLVSQYFVWDIQVVGNSTVRTEVILEELSELGVERFAFIPELDFLRKRDEALLQIPQLAWMSITRTGSRLTVYVTERTYPPKLDTEEPCDIVASRTGQIHYMEVYNGTEVRKVNDTVIQGDVLVSGIQVTKNGNTAQVHSSAKIIAEVQFEKTLSLDLAQYSKVYTGKEKTRYYLELFSLRIPLYLAASVEGEYDLSASLNLLRLFGKEFPIGIGSLHYRFYEKQSGELSLEEGRKILREQFAQYEALELADTAILGRDIAEVVRGGVLSMTVQYLAEEDIAREAPLDLSFLPRTDTPE